MNKFVIQNVNDDELFWNSEYGWVDFKTADIFIDDEIEIYTLPMEGKWLLFDGIE